MLIAYYYREVESNRAQKVFDKHSSFIVSELNAIEFISASRKKVRMGHTSEDEIQKVISLFNDHKDQLHYNTLPLSKNHYKAAEHIIRTTQKPLRSLDAVHLGIIYEENLKLFSFDKTMIKTAKEFKIPVLKT